MIGVNAVLDGEMVFDRAVEVLGTAERAVEWMGCKDSLLGGKPGELVKTGDGMAQVLHCLRRIELDQPV
ncbi:antitoxin Xre/MbcA/ParS toxin-binding domain-containing protein [Azospirillum sp. B510]|uniref:antitoxin Xre/MbcA/ParS toxin-binding domain-containing protein n=1 Tax=Azospirillum sp. (strain B510) TaxID=137722 RepID=UPI0002ECCE5B|nr:antitoxin Xre/MbcA/ParS toxin-binding domain-containing protein [Azospirillum sp. B510]